MSTTGKESMTEQVHQAYHKAKAERQAELLATYDHYRFPMDLAGFTLWSKSLPFEDGELLLDGLRARGEI